MVEDGIVGDGTNWCLYLMGRQAEDTWGNWDETMGEGKYVTRAVGSAQTADRSQQYRSILYKACCLWVK